LRISTSYRIEALYAVSLSAVVDNGTSLSYKQSQPKQKQVWIYSIERAHAWLGILIVWTFAILSTLAHVQPHSVRYQLMTLSSQCLTGVSQWHINLNHWCKLVYQAYKISFPQQLELRDDSKTEGLQGNIEPEIQQFVKRDSDSVLLIVLTCCGG